jgi:phosphatidate cytidylyltransferase
MTLPWLFGGTVAVLTIGTAAGQALRCTVRSEPARATVANMNVRIAAWWVLCGLTGLALALGEAAVIVLFALFSSLAIREYISLTKPASFWPFLVFTPLQYGLLWTRSYEMFRILIPVAAFLSIPPYNALAVGAGSFLDRTAKAYWGLMICTYCLSHAPALLMLNIPGYAGRNTTLLFYFLLVVQLSDVMQYVWGKLLGRRPIAPRISPNKTWEGFLGGVITATAVGAALYRATPFHPWQAAGMCAAITLMGFAGGLTMSAIKRDYGVKDFGTIIAGHGGILDRIDSLCFSAPIFFHLTRHFYT